MEIKEIKSRLDITEVARHLGIQINQRTKRALCPFHNDKNPSLQFSQEKQICTCFSSNCNLGTVDIIGLTEKSKNLNTHKALKYLSELAGELKPIISEQKKQPPPACLPKQSEGTEPEQAARIAVLKKSFSFFENALIASSPAREYLESRNLDLQQIKAGYQAGTLHHGENKHLIESLEQIGLLKKINSGHAPFGLGSIVFPLRNKKNEITGLYFRAVEPRPGKFKGRNYEKHLYLKNRQGLYPSYPKPNTTKLLIPESIIDTATLQQIPEITEGYQLLSSYGTNGITEEHKQAIKELKELEEIILFFDGDQTGRTGAEKAAADLRKNNTCIVSIVETPENEDINSLSLGHTPELFTELLQNRKPFIFQKKTSTEQSSFEDKKRVEPKSTPPSSCPGQENNLPLTINHSSLNTSNPYKISYTTETAIYYIKGGIPRTLDSMKVSIEISPPGHEQEKTYKRKHRSKVDLYEDKQTVKAAREAGEKLGIRSDLIELDLNYLTDLLDEHREEKIKKEEEKENPRPVIVTDKDKYIRFGRRKDLMQSLNRLIGKSGIVGEENNSLFLFTCACSHKMKKTLHVVVQGSSGSGKTHLIKKISENMPQEKVKNFTRVSDRSFYNYGEYDLCNSLIVLEDYDGMGEEAELAWRELQSNEKLVSSISQKNENNNEIRSGEKIVRGPIASMVATTKGDIYFDNESRVFFIAIDESREQTQKIINYKNQLANGEIKKEEQEKAKNFLQNYIRTLQAKQVRNPWLKYIDLPVNNEQKRRLHSLFDHFCEQITLLHQHQRKTDQQGRLISEKQDIEIAVKLMFESIILKVDELDGALRSFYEKLKSYVKKRGNKYEFSRLEIRQSLKVSKTQQHGYFNTLLDLEYIYQSGGYPNRGYKYKINYWDDNQKLREKIKQELEKQLEKL